MKIEYKSTIKSTKVALQNSKLRFHLIKILSLSVTHVVFFFFFFWVALAIMFTLIVPTKYYTF